MKRTRDYQLIDEIIWSDEYIINGRSKHCTLKQSYGSYSKAYDEAHIGMKNPAIEHKTSTIVYKPTGEVLITIEVK